jgi:hypothetical protein
MLQLAKTKTGLGCRMPSVEIGIRVVRIIALDQVNITPLKKNRLVTC